MWKKKIAFLLLFCFSFALLPVMPAEAAVIVTTVDDWYFADYNLRPTEAVGQAYYLVIEFETTSEREKPKIRLDKRITPKALSAQPDKDKIDQIVNGSVTIKAGLEDEDKRVVIAFEEPLTIAGDYQMPIRIGNSSINPSEKEYLRLVPGPAVIINTAEATSQSAHSDFEIEIDDPRDVSDEVREYEAKITLHLRDQYNNPTNTLPEGYNLVMRFVPRKNKSFDEYQLTSLNGVQDLTDSYTIINDATIAASDHALGEVSFRVKVEERKDYDDIEVPAVYAALAADGTAAIEPRYTLEGAIGFIAKNRNEGGTLLAYQNIRVGFTDNYFTITINGIYPAAGKRFRLEFPSGYKVESTGRNYAYFDYNDIGKTITVKMSSIPKKPDPDFNFDEDSLTVYRSSKDPNDQLTYEVLNADLGIVASGLADSAKSKLALGKTKKVPANDSTAIEGSMQLNDLNGNYTSDLADDYHVFLWAERDGKVSTTETFEKTADSDITIEPSTLSDVDNGVAGVYEVTGFIEEEHKGLIPFQVRSTLEGTAQIKAAIAPNAYTAVLYRDKDEGLFSNELKVTFEPYAAGDTWRFTNVKVSGIKANELSSDSQGLHYQVLKTKKSNGADKFSVTAQLSATNSTVKLKDEEVVLTCHNDAISISDKNGKSKDGKLTIKTDGSGKIKFDVVADKDGTYTIDVKATNGKSGGGVFDIKLPYDATGGTIIDDTTTDPNDLGARLKNVSKIVVDEQSSMLLAVGDTLYVRFRLYDSKGREIRIENDEEADQAVRIIDLTVPTGSELEGGKNKDVEIEADDGGILLSFDADKLGKYSIGMTITTGKSGKASFNVDQQNRIVALRLEYDQLGLDLGQSSSKGRLVFVDDEDREYVEEIPVKGIELSASGKPLESFDPKTGIVKARKDDNSSGSVITVRALDRAHNLEATYRFVVGHDILPLEFSNTSGYVHQTLYMTTKITDDFNRSLPLGALDPDRGAQMTVTVLSKPANAVVRTELEDNGSSFAQNGMNVLKVRSDRIGPVRIRLDIRAVDPNYSTKYPIYTYLSGVVDVNFNYPGILDSKPFFEGYSAGNATLMYIGSNTYVHRGQVSYMDAPPFILNDRTFIPVRAMGDSLNAETYYNAGNQTIQIYTDNNTIRMQIGSPVISTTQSGNVHSDVVPFIQDGRTYLPLRVVAEIFGCKVDPIYDEDEVIGVIFAN